MFTIADLGALVAFRDIRQIIRKVNLDELKAQEALGGSIQFVEELLKPGILEEIDEHFLRIGSLANARPTLNCSAEM